MNRSDKIHQLLHETFPEEGPPTGADERILHDASTIMKQTQTAVRQQHSVSTWRQIMKNPFTKISTAAVVLLTAYLCLQVPKDLVAPAYALQDTLSAYNSIRTVHMKEFSTVYGQRWEAESWIELDGYGKPMRFRYETNRISTGDDIGPVTIVNDGAGSYTWLPKPNVCFTRAGESVIGSSLVQWEVSDADPKRVIEKLQQQATNGEIILDVNEPKRKSKPIVLTVTYPAESRSVHWKKVLYIDQATRLLKKEEKFEKQDGHFQHKRTVEFLAYNQPFEPRMFSLTGELSDNVMMIDQSAKAVGLPQGIMTDADIAKEVAVQFWQAFFVKDFDKVGQLLFGVPSFFLETLLGGGGESDFQIISVGSVHRDPDPDSNVLICPIKISSTYEGQRYENDTTLSVTTVSGQPGRWMVCGINGNPKPVSNPPRPAETVFISPGIFMMGSPNDEQDRDSDEGPQHQVTLTQGFHMGKHVVTVGQYVTFLTETGEESGVDWDDNDCPLSRKNGSYTLRDGRSWNQPMAEVSWFGAALYCNYLSHKEGLELVYNPDTWDVNWHANGYRLPTEAEWEYACRAGTQTRFYWGDDPNYSDIEYYCWYDGAKRPSGLKEVGQKQPNAFGLYDMSGYVYEWCQDWYGSYSASHQTDPTGPASGTKRVLRGGFRDEVARNCRSAKRDHNPPDTSHSSIGFRVLRSAP